MVVCYTDITAYHTNGEFAMVISIANNKGGTGKTTTAVNLGAALAFNDFSILEVDLDPQGNLSINLVHVGRSS